jgi:hypothetical protein
MCTGGTCGEGTACVLEHLACEACVTATRGREQTEARREHLRGHVKEVEWCPPADCPTQKYLR